MNYDKWSVRMTILILGAVIMLTTITACVQAYRGQQVDALIASLVTGTVALLIPSPLSKAKYDDSDGPVEVTTPPGEPLAVEDING